MAENNIDKALSYLGSQINALVNNSQSTIDPQNIYKSIPKRSLTGDHINGGIIVNFSSTGIKDNATTTQLTVNDDRVEIKNLKVEKITEINTDQISAKKIVVDFLEVKDLKTENKNERNSPLEFVGDSNSNLFGKGMLFKGQGTTKQFIFSGNPDKFLSTENLGLSKDRAFYIDNTQVLSSTELGSGIIKSNLRELGRLKGLIVEGNVNIDHHIYYNSSNNRFGLGIDRPNSTLSVCEDGIEIVIGTGDGTRGKIGTFASQGFDLVTDDTPRISIASSGNIELGNSFKPPIQVKVHGKLAVNVNNVDTRADLHVAGAIKYNDRIHQYDINFPTNGLYERGSIVWNSLPDAGKPVGWVCVKSGTPGLWLPFGEIKNMQ